jgi:predicted homoserine dehydrogenase-like protein
MKKVIRLNESDIQRIVKRVLKEQNQKLSRKQLVDLLHEWAIQFNPNQQVGPSIFPIIFKTRAKDFSQLEQLDNGKDNLYNILTEYILTYRNKEYSKNFSIIDPKFPELGF